MELWHDSSSVSSCMSSPKRNVTVLITNVYEGIPETLTLNVICWVCLLGLFALLRRNAWNYGRLALVHVSNKWTHLFYGTHEPQTPDVDSGPDSLSYIDARYCSWVPAVFKLSREQIGSRCGPDAVHYLSFQRHLITLMFIIMLLSISVILPINFHGHLEGNETTFGHTTMANLEPTSPWLWVHALMGILYLPIAILLMRRSTGRKPLPDYATRALMITNIGRRDRNRDAIESFLHQKYPDISILDVEIAYDTKDLQKIDEKREMAYKAKVFSENHLKKTGKPIQVRMSLFGKKVDAVEYYTAKEKKLIGEMERKKAMTMYEPLGIAFVTLSSYQEVEHVISTFVPGSYQQWILSNAPAPTDIFWENLSVEPNVWYFKAFFLNSCLFIVLFFLTTPAIIVNMIDAFYIDHDSVITRISPVISEFLPTLLLWTMAATLPVIVSYSDQLLSYWTRSKLTYSVMVKTFSFLLLMTLILPSLGLTSAQAFVEWTLQRDNGTYRWECVFLPDKGAFFVNYVITSAFIGTALELIRFSELCLFIYYMCKAKSKAEKAYVQRAILLEFPFGVHYAWTLVVFTITTVYSLACPLITPFGMVYLLLKHFGDKYNLYFAYKSSDMSGVDGGKIHATAVRMVRVSILFLQISMAALAGIRGGMDARTIILILTTLVTLGMLFMLSPFPSCNRQPSQNQSTQIQSKYIAPVLVKAINSISMKSLNNYGSSDGSEPSNNQLAVDI